jgi:hypothetical protein
MGTSCISQVQKVQRIVMIIYKITYADRYKDAENSLRANPQVKHLVSHSLGSSVAVELTKQHAYKNSELKALYASPFVDFGGKTHENRFRHSGDVISMSDRGSKTVDLGLVSPLTAHGYDNY